jgi:hypothetical protein
VDCLLVTLTEYPASTVQVSDRTSIPWDFPRVFTMAGPCLMCMCPGTYQGGQEARA